MFEKDLTVRIGGEKYRYIIRSMIGPNALIELSYKKMLFRVSLALSKSTTADLEVRGVPQNDI